MKLFLNPFPNKSTSTWLPYKSFENTVGKEEIARNEQFLPFPTVFSTLFENFLPFMSNEKMSSANSFSLEESKICRLGEVDQTMRCFKDPVRRVYL